MSLELGVPWVATFFGDVQAQRCRELEERQPFFLFDYQCCAFAAHYRKAANLATNMEALGQLGLRCSGSHVHDTLHGTVLLHGRKVWKKSLAHRQPPTLCRKWAQILQHEAPAGARLRPREKAETCLGRIQANFTRATGCSTSAAVAALQENGTREWPDCDSTGGR